MLWRWEKCKIKISSYFATYFYYIKKYLFNPCSNGLLLKPSSEASIRDDICLKYYFHYMKKYYFNPRILRVAKYSKYVASNIFDIFDYTKFNTKSQG